MLKDFVSIGDVCNYDKMDQKTDGQSFLQVFWQNGRLTGVNLLDSYTEAGVIRYAVIKGLRQTKASGIDSLTAVQNILLSNILTEVKIS